jgi:catechol 2,3-dioxygenase-like lactoylglutathione lyase family enzyme
MAMLDHVFLSVSDIERSIAFYSQALGPLGITDRVDYDGKDGPPGHPDLKGFGRKGRIFFWLRKRGGRPVGACRLRGRLVDAYVGVGLVELDLAGLSQRVNRCVNSA